MGPNIFDATSPLPMNLWVGDLLLVTLPHDELKNQHSIQALESNDEKTTKSHCSRSAIIREEEKDNKVEPYQHPHFHEVIWRYYKQSSTKQWLDPTKKSRPKNNPRQRRTTNKETKLDLKCESPTIQHFEGKDSQKGEACNDPNKRFMSPKWKTHSYSSTYKPWRPMLWGRNILRGSGSKPLCMIMVNYVITMISSVA